MTRRTSSIAAVALLFVAACGDDGKSDQQIADEVLAAVQSDLEDDGFVEEEDGGAEEDDGDLEFQSAECKELDEAFGDTDELPGETASAELATFDRGDLDADGVEETVDTMVGIVEDAADLDAVLEPVGDGRLASCLEEALVASFEEDAAPGEVVPELSDVTSDTADSDVGDSGYAVAFDATVSAAGFAFPLEMDLVLARADRSMIFVFTSALGTGTTEANADAIASGLASDLEEQLA